MDTPNAAPPLVSIVIPTFRRPELLEQRALRSALSQTYPHTEVVVVIDGGDAVTLPYLQAKPQDPRVRVFQQPTNQGPAAARNRGVQESRGDWLVFIDDDDECLPDRVAEPLRLALSSRVPYPVVLSGYVGRTPRTEHRHPHRLKEPGESLGDYLFVRRSPRDPHCLMHNGVMLVPRPLMQRVPFNPALRNYEDWDWMLRAEATPGVQILQLPPAVTSALYIYYWVDHAHIDEHRRDWRKNLDWAQEHWRAGRLSPRAVAGLILTQMTPIAAAAGDRQAALALGRALLRTRPTVLEGLRFVRHWAVPVKWRNRVRAWLEARQQVQRVAAE